MTSGPTPGTRVEDAAETNGVGAGRDAPATESDVRASPPTTPLARALFLASILVAVLPIAVATTRAIYNGWIPTGDNGLFAIRARDMFSLTHLPLLGTWSSASLTVGTQVNHPGPLYIDLLALPARVIDGGAGIAFAVAVVNAACIVGIAVFAFRRGGALIGVLAMAATTALCWTMGSELLFEPWNPHSALLPFAFFLVLVWSMTCGDIPAIPFAAGVGSLVLQSHLAYALLVPLLGAWGVVGCVFWLRRSRCDERTAWPALRRRALALVAIGGAVLVVCWIQPLIEQFTSDGSGNLTRLVESSRDSGAETIGYGLGTRIVAGVISLPPWWFRPSMKEAFVSGWDAPSLGAALATLGVVVAALAVCAWDARRRGDRVSVCAVATAAAALVFGVVTAGQGPVTVFGDVTPHTFRWLWPLGAFVFFAIAVTVARRLAQRQAASAVLVALFAVATLVFAVLNLPYADEGLGPNSQQYAIPAETDLERHMGALDAEGPLLIDDLFHGVFADPYGGAVIAELQRRGIPFVARESGLVRQFGPARRYDGRNAKAELLLRTGDASLAAPPGSRRVARGEGLSAADERQLTRLKARIVDYIEARRLRLNQRGQAAIARGDLPKLVDVQQKAADSQVLLDSRELDVMVKERYLDVNGVWARRLERYAELQHRWDLETVALFVRPLDSSTATSGRAL